MERFEEDNKNNFPLRKKKFNGILTGAAAIAAVSLWACTGEPDIMSLPVDRVDSGENERRDIIRDCKSGVERAGNSYEITEGNTENPLSEGERNILREIMNSVDPRFTEFLREVTVYDFNDTTPVGSEFSGYYANERIHINRASYSDFTSIKLADLVITVYHEVGHHVTNHGHVREFFEFPTTIRSSHSEDFASHFAAFMQQNDALLLYAYYDGPDIGLENQDIFRQQYEWMRDNLFCGEVPAVIIPEWSTHALGNLILTGEPRNYVIDFPESRPEVLEATTRYLENNPDPRLVPLFTYMNTLCRIHPNNLEIDDPNPWLPDVSDEKAAIIRDVLTKLEDNSAYNIMLQRELGHLYSVRGDYETAIPFLHNVLDWAKENYRIDLKVEMLMEMGYIALNMGRPNVAVNNYFLQIVTLYPQTRWALEAQAEIDAINQ